MIEAVLPAVEDNLRRVKEQEISVEKILVLDELITFLCSILTLQIESNVV